MIVKTVTAGVACALAIGNEVLPEKIVNNYSVKRQYKRAQPTFIYFDKFYGKILQKNVNDKTEKESSKFFTKLVYEKNDSVLEKRYEKMKIFQTAIRKNQGCMASRKVRKTKARNQPKIPRNKLRTKASFMCLECSFFSYNSFSKIAQVISKVISSLEKKIFVKIVQLRKIK